MAAFRKVTFFPGLIPIIPSPRRLQLLQNVGLREKSLRGWGRGWVLVDQSGRRGKLENLGDRILKSETEFS